MIIPTLFDTPTLTSETLLLIFFLGYNLLVFSAEQEHKITNMKSIFIIILYIAINKAYVLS